MTEKGLTTTLISLIVLLVVALGIKYWYIFNLTPFQYVISKGSKESTVFPGRFDYGDYGFFVNNRAVRFSDKKKGFYDKKKITFDDGEIVQLSTVFK